MSVQGTAWPNVLADMVAKRDALTTIIDMIRTHFAGDEPGEMPDSTAAARQPDRRPKAERRAKPARASSVNHDADVHGQAILAALKKHGGVMKPGDLARAVKLEPANLRYRLKPLEKSKQVLVTGATAGRRISLPGAKEAP